MTRVRLEKGCCHCSKRDWGEKGKLIHRLPGEVCGEKKHQTFNTVKLNLLSGLRKA